MRLKANDNQMPGLALRAAAIRSSLTQARKDTDGIRPGFHFVDHRLAEPGIGEGPGAEGREEPLRTPGERAPELPLHDIMVRLALSSGECVRVAGAGARGTPPFT